MITDYIHGIHKFLITLHRLCNGITDYVCLVRNNQLDLPEKLQSLLILDGCCTLCSDPFCKLLGIFYIAGTAPRFVNIRINVINHITVLLISGKNTLLIPDVPILILLHPRRCTPAQDADLQIRIDLFGIRCKLPSRITKNIGFLALRSHRSTLCTGRIVAVITHLQLHMRKDRILSAKQILHQLCIFFRILRLIIHQ